MKIVVVSDTHGQTDEFKRIYNHYKDEADYFIHCGDVGFDTSTCNDLQQFIIVEGNCDLGTYPLSQSLPCGNNNILITHGHLLDVKWDLNRLYYTALEQNANIVCFGHTHQPLHHVVNGVVMVNPGSLFANRGVRGKTYAILTLDNKDINVTHFNAETLEVYTELHLVNS